METNSDGHYFTDYIYSIQFSYNEVKSIKRPAFFFSSCFCNGLTYCLTGPLAQIYYILYVYISQFMMQTSTSDASVRTFPFIKFIFVIIYLVRWQMGVDAKNIPYK